MKYLLILFFPLLSFSQIDSVRFIDKFYLEPNVGFGGYHYSLYYLGNGSNPPIREEALTRFINFDLSLNFRNRFFKLGMNPFGLKYFNSNSYGSSSFQISTNLLSFSKGNSNYVGPFLSLGKLWASPFDPKVEYVSTGMEVYTGKFHLAFYFTKFNKTYLNTTNDNMYLFGIDLGYSFNLNSFKKGNKSLGS